MKILVTGAQGFIAKNLIVRLAEHGYTDIVRFDRSHSINDLQSILSDVAFVFHLAGVNRPKDDKEFLQGNTDLTAHLVDALKKTQRRIPLVFTSSIQAERDNAYGRSKLEAEKLVLGYMQDTDAPAYVYRLPNVFGKWCKPNYNSAVATFCHNIVKGLPITVHDKNAALSLVYIDDVCDAIISLLGDKENGGYKNVTPVYQTTVGGVVETLQKFKQSRDNLVIEDVGVGLTRALYSTYLSYFSPEQFSYLIPGYTDPRGTFVEMLKTPNTGQFSFFTAHPGVTRGGHYHHSKNEKFLVIKGKASYRFKHIITDEFFELTTDSTEHRIIETIPGWSHDITNVGDEVLIVMLWANEIFDRNNPDTIASPLV
ncbi:NAD-dependent epimerase/dehydratase family protein [Kangiella sp.]|uniref:UDP-2-acetamido-2,6-beta-L-arabino-hexul-4-ose reductase n=1 Tax=Kangiella sp. TaxID=1920245 RepID=UPI00199A9EDB|nr:NAD-dependent epimerase/dehydratase family protein [Kangiella sp.]MBD3652394.1 SDR family oxidoreductase [Kangiella sp.]